MQGNQVEIDYTQMNNKDLETQIFLLKELCQNLDPYDMDDETWPKKLEKVSIMKWSDPFELTNLLILRMEEAINEQKKRNLH